MERKKQFIQKHHSMQALNGSFEFFIPGKFAPRKRLRNSYRSLQRNCW
jgi:hypothetical protein